jgi:hypothetical protein
LKTRKENVLQARLKDWIIDWARSDFEQVVFSMPFKDCSSNMLSRALAKHSQVMILIPTYFKWSNDYNYSAMKTKVQRITVLKSTQLSKNILKSDVLPSRDDMTDDSTVQILFYDGFMMKDITYEVKNEVGLVYN